MKVIRLLTVGVLAAAGLAVGIGAASAHVVVDPSTAAPGTELAVLTFRVPSESAKANTVGVTITMPTKAPLATVRYKDVAGWTAKAVTTDLATPAMDGDAAASPKVQASPAAGSNAAAGPSVSSTDGTARTLGVIGIIVAALSLLVAAVGIGRRPRRATQVRTDAAGPSS